MNESSQKFLSLFAEIWNNRNTLDPAEEEAQFAEFLKNRNVTKNADEPYATEWADEETDSPYEKLWDSW